MFRSRLKWAGHVEIMGGVKLAKRAGVREVEEKGGEEDRNCNGTTGINLERVGEEWKTRATDRRNWRLLI